MKAIYAIKMGYSEKIFSVWSKKMKFIPKSSMQKIELVSRQQISMNYWKVYGSDLFEGWIKLEIPSKINPPAQSEQE